MWSTSGNVINVTANGSILKDTAGDADILVAVYDGGVLQTTRILNIDSSLSEASFNDFTIMLDREPSNVTVKSFLWSADGKCIPLAEASELNDVPGNVNGYPIERPSYSDWEKYIYDNPNGRVTLVDGVEYPVNTSAISMNDLSIGSEYTFYLDALGFVAYFDANIFADVSYGVITGMYQDAGDDYPTVKLITADGELVSYECRDDSTAREFYRSASGEENSWGSGYLISTRSIRDRILAGQTVCTYRLSGDKIVFGNALAGYGGMLTYNEAEGSMGGYSLSGSARMISISDFMDDNYESDAIHSVSADDLYNGSQYMAYVYAPDSKNKYEFALIAEGEVRLPEYDPEADPTYVEEDYGIITALYYAEGKDILTVRLINSNGELVDYECKNASEQSSFYTRATDSWGAEAVSKSDIRSRIFSGETLCRYSVRNGKISYVSNAYAFGGEGLAYANGVLGETDITNAKIIYLAEYRYGSDIYILTAEQLTGDQYDAYILQDEECNVVVITGGEQELPEYDPTQDPTYVDNGYGVILSMRKIAGNDYNSVTIMTEDGMIREYECASEQTERDIYNYAIGNNNYYYSMTFTQHGISNRIKAGETAFIYSVENGKLSFVTGCSPQGGKSLQYNASNQSLGSYKISNTARILDMDTYFRFDTSEVPLVQLSALEDGSDYDACVYYGTDDGFGIVLIFNDLDPVCPETQIAVVKSVNGAADVNGVNCYEYTVYRGNAEETVYLDGGYYGTGPQEGSVLAYRESPDGYVTSDDLYIIYNPAPGYYYTLDGILGKEDFSETLNYVTDDNGKKAVSYDGEKISAKGVYEYFGAVYKKSGNSFEMFTRQSGGKSDISEVKPFEIDSGTNIYTFDYGERANKGVRLSVGNVYTKQSQYLFNPAFVGNDVRWDYVMENELQPQLAFVKEINGKVTDVVFYIDG